VKQVALLPQRGRPCFVSVSS